MQIMRVLFFTLFILLSLSSQSQDVHVKKQAVPSILLERHPNWRDSLSFGLQRFVLPELVEEATDNMPVLNLKQLHLIITEKNNQGFSVYESLPDHMKGVMPSKEWVFNMPVAGSTRVSPKGD